MIMTMKTMKKKKDIKRYLKLTNLLLANKKNKNALINS